MRYSAKVSFGLALMVSLQAFSIKASANQSKLNCELRGEATLFLSGSIDESMLNCAQRNLTDKIEYVSVSTVGGNVEMGHKIARLISQRPRTLIVEDYCLSSCGNYFVPASHKVILRPRAFIGLHGSVDPYTVYQLDDVTDKMKRTIEAEEKFAVDFSVPLGWRIYRPADYSGGVETPDMAGSLRPSTHKRKSRMIVIEPSFAESCLPHIDFTWEGGAQSFFAEDGLINELNAQGLVGTGSLECKPNTGQQQPRPR